MLFMCWGLQKTWKCQSFHYYTFFNFGLEILTIFLFSSENKNNEFAQPDTVQKKHFFDQLSEHVVIFNKYKKSCFLYTYKV